MRKIARSLDLASLWSALIEVCTNRIAAGYTLASTLTSIGLFSYIVLVQQIYGELYGLGGWFPLAFAIGAVGIAIASVVSGNVRQPLWHSLYGPSVDEPVRLCGHGAVHPVPVWQSAILGHV